MDWKYFLIHLSRAKQTCECHANHIAFVWFSRRRCASSRPSRHRSIRGQVFKNQQDAISLLCRYVGKAVLREPCAHRAVVARADRPVRACYLQRRAAADGECSGEPFDFPAASLSAAPQFDQADGPRSKTKSQ